RLRYSTKLLGWSVTAARVLGPHRTFLKPFKQHELLAAIKELVPTLLRQTISIFCPSIHIELGRRLHPRPAEKRGQATFRGTRTKSSQSPLDPVRVVAGFGRSGGQGAQPFDNRGDFRR